MLKKDVDPTILVIAMLQCLVAERSDEIRVKNARFNVPMSTPIFNALVCEPVARITQ